MAFGKTLVVLLAAVAFASAQTHNPAYDPFYHPTGRPAQNALAGATSQNSPGFPQISKLLPLVQADNIGPTLNTATTKLVSELPRPALFAVLLAVLLQSQCLASEVPRVILSSTNT